MDAGIPVSSWLAMHSSRELTEIAAYFKLEAAEHEREAKRAELQAKIKRGR